MSPELIPSTQVRAFIVVETVLAQVFSQFPLGESKPASFANPGGNNRSIIGGMSLNHGIPIGS
jgi:hypothetical protein